MIGIPLCCCHCGELLFSDMDTGGCIYCGAPQFEPALTEWKQRQQEDIQQMLEDVDGVGEFVCSTVRGCSHFLEMYGDRFIPTKLTAVQDGDEYKVEMSGHMNGSPIEFELVLGEGGMELLKLWLAEKDMPQLLKGGQS